MVGASSCVGVRGSLASGCIMLMSPRLIPPALSRAEGAAITYSSQNTVPSLPAIPFCSICIRCHAAVFLSLGKLFPLPLLSHEPLQQGSRGRRQPRATFSLSSVQMANRRPVKPMTSSHNPGNTVSTKVSGFPSLEDFGQARGLSVLLTYIMNET